jgi:hypothetical protein
MNNVSPVLTERELPIEQVIALGQDEYYPVIGARVVFPDKSVGTYTRFRFTDRERAAIAQGADLILCQPHHGPLMPIALQLAFPDEYPLAEEMLK